MRQQIQVWCRKRTCKIQKVQVFLGFPAKSPTSQAQQGKFAILVVICKLWGIWICDCSQANWLNTEFTPVPHTLNPSDTFLHRPAEQALYFPGTLVMADGAGGSLKILDFTESGSKGQRLLTSGAPGGVTPSHHHPPLHVPQCPLRQALGREVSYTFLQWKQVTPEKKSRCTTIAKGRTIRKRLLTQAVQFTPK